MPHLHNAWTALPCLTCININQSRCDSPRTINMNKPAADFKRRDADVYWDGKPLVYVCRIITLHRTLPAGPRRPYPASPWDQSLDEWGISRGRGARRGQGCLSAAQTPSGTRSPDSARGFLFLWGWWTDRWKRERERERGSVIFIERI